MQDLAALRAERPNFIFYDETYEGIGTSVWIPEKQKMRASWFLKDGGWQTVFDAKHKRVTEQQQEESRLRKLQEENLVAVTQQAKQAIEDSARAREEAARARHIASIANWIAVVSAATAIATFLAAIFLVK